MSSKDSHLYHHRQPNLKGGKEISSSNSLAFTSQLSSLINAPSSRSAKPTSARAKAPKDDLFRRPNRNTAKRAKLDLDNAAVALQQKHTTNGETLDSELWQRSKRKMEEKARLYAAMKRGDVDDEDERYAVDFDRKWADAQDAGKELGSQEEEDDDDSDLDEADKEVVTYTDEFGRTRTGTRTEAARTQRTLRAQEDLASDKYTARPSAPSNIIRGDTIQHAAFQPDAVIADQMEELARKRDRSLTPPPEEHFDGKKEVRSKGTGFFQFSGDQEERRRQMAGLEAERAETERVRRAMGKRKADAFLEELEEQLNARPPEAKAKDDHGGGEK